MMTEAILRVEHLSASYGGIKAVHDISFEVRSGEIVSVLGANGAGKSTLLKCLSGEHKKFSGKVAFQGKSLPSKPYEIVERGISIVPEGRQIFYKLTVHENLRIGTCQRKDKDEAAKDIERIYQMFPRLKERYSHYGGLLSGGEQQMLAVARGLMSRPKLMMLDEPSLGLAPIIVNQIMDILQKVRESGASILLVEQNAVKALQISDRAYVMNAGRIIMQGTGEELLHDELLTSAYLG